MGSSETPNVTASDKTMSASNTAEKQGTVSSITDEKKKVEPKTTEVKAKFGLGR
jgi:hypothetical protein